MGKTKTIIVGNEAADEEGKKKEKKAIKKEPKKIGRVPGLKGGERIKVVGGELPPVEEKKGEAEGEEKKSKTRKRPARVRGKKYKEARAKVDEQKLYSLGEAVKLVKELNYAKFDATVEMHLAVKKEKLAVNVEMPFSSGKARRVEVANEGTIKKLRAGKIDFDVLLATPEMMPKLVPFAKILGPKGLMPNPKNQTLIKSEAEAKKFSGNRVAVKTEKGAPIVHVTIGKVSQKDSELTKNAEAILEAIGLKQIVKVYLCTTMSPSVKVEVS